MPPEHEVTGSSPVGRTSSTQLAPLGRPAERGFSFRGIAARMRLQGDPHGVRIRLLAVLNSPEGQAEIARQNYNKQLESQSKYLKKMWQDYGIPADESMKSRITDSSGTVIRK